MKFRAKKVESKAVFALSLFLAVVSLSQLPRTSQAQESPSSISDADLSATETEVLKRIADEKSGVLEFDGPDKLSAAEVRFRDSCANWRKSDSQAVQSTCKGALVKIYSEREKVRLQEGDHQTLLKEVGRLMQEKKKLVEENKRLRAEIGQCHPAGVPSTGVKVPNGLAGVADSVEGRGGTAKSSGIVE
jgi:hypothetical protein